MGAVEPVCALGVLGTAGTALIMFGRQVVLDLAAWAAERERQTTVRHVVDGAVRHTRSGGVTVVVLALGPSIPASAADSSQERAA